MAVLLILKNFVYATFFVPLCRDCAFPFDLQLEWRYIFQMNENLVCNEMAKPPSWRGTTWGLTEASFRLDWKWERLRFLAMKAHPTSSKLSIWLCKCIIPLPTESLETVLPVGHGCPLKYVLLLLPFMCFTLVEQRAQPCSSTEYFLTETKLEYLRKWLPQNYHRVFLFKGHPKAFPVVTVWWLSDLR